MSTQRKDPAQLKVVGLGFARTGTLSLCAALEKLGFGSCLHTLIPNLDKDYYQKFLRVMEGDGRPELLDDIYRGYASALDVPTAVLAESLYKAYPDAKYILTVRDPVKWAESYKSTAYPSLVAAEERDARIAAGTATEEDLSVNKKLEELGVAQWTRVWHRGYHQRRLVTDPEGEFLRHNQRVIELIPPEKLLLFNVADGWKPLVQFLGVPEPNEPFPRKNDAQAFQEAMAKHVQEILSSDVSA